jgi:hypothetical protein
MDKCKSFYSRGAIRLIVLNGTLPIDDKKKWVFAIIPDVDGTDCEFTHVAPVDLSGSELEAFLDSKEDFYKLDILKDMYPGAIIPPSENLTPLKAFEAWIVSGHHIPVLDSDGNETTVVITKIPWTGKHPDKMDDPGLSSDAIEALHGLDATDKDMARITEDLIDVLKAKGFISDADFHSSIKAKIDYRKSLREILK